MGIKEIVGCGDFVSEMSKLVLHDNPTTIKNILKCIYIKLADKEEQFIDVDRLYTYLKELSKIHFKALKELYLNNNRISDINIMEKMYFQSLEILY